MSEVSEMTQENSVCMQSVDMDLTCLPPGNTSLQQVMFVCVFNALPLLPILRLLEESVPVTEWRDWKKQFKLSSSALICLFLLLD